MGMGYEVAGGQLCVAGKLFANFDFWNRPNRVLERRFGISLVTVSQQSRDTHMGPPKCSYNTQLTQRADAERRRTQGGVWWVWGGYGFGSGGGPGG